MAELEKMTEAEKARTISVTRLLKYFRSLELYNEQLGIDVKEPVGVLIGAVRILEAQAKGEFVEKK